MKKTFLFTFIILTLAAFLFVSCKKETSFMNDAIITGSDARTCICCGGLMITFNGETIENGGDIGITDKDTFPIYVKVDWKEDTTNVCNHILITRIARR
jgi:hypothetical protein